MISKFLAKAAVIPPRKPIVKTPKDYGLEYEDVTFRADDGVKLKGWYIPSNTDRLIIFTHPMPFNRYGFHTKGQGLAKMSNVEVELLKTVKQLNLAGYGVFIFDFRNHGESDSANKGVCGVGYHEWPDVVAAMKYIKSNDQLKDKSIGMVINCMGANSALIAMSKEPGLFDEVKAVVAIQPVSYDIFMQHYLQDKMALFKGRFNSINEQVKKIAGVGFEEMSPSKYVADIKAPIMYVQVKNDAWTEPADVQSFYDKTQSEKTLFWIEGDLERFDGYNYFGEHPEKMLAWLDRFMK